MHLQPLRSRSSALAHGSPILSSNISNSQLVMDIENLLNDRTPQLPSKSSSTSISTATSSSQMSQAHLALSSAHHSHPSSSSIPNFDSRSPMTSEYMASYSPQSMQRSVGYSPQAGGYPDGVPYPPHMAGSEPNAANSQLPYDPTIEERSRAAVVAAAAQQDLGAPQMAQQPANGEDSIDGEDALPKAFACVTCHKGFARRSDLVRHGEFPWTPY